MKDTRHSLNEKISLLMKILINLAIKLCRHEPLRDDISVFWVKFGFHRVVSDVQGWYLKFLVHNSGLKQLDCNHLKEISKKMKELS